MAEIDVVVPDLGIGSAGNSVTANRYCSIFGQLGHVATTTDTPTAPLVVALNAYRTRHVVGELPETTTVIVVLTGTDIYRFWDQDRDAVSCTLDRADVIVGLNDLVGRSLPTKHRAKLTCIKEGALALSTEPTRPTSPPLHAICVGHLRDEKAPELIADALDRLDPNCDVVVDHYGAAHSESWAQWARDTSERIEQYQWHREVSRSRLDEIYAGADLLINTSKMEGGANVISEAVMAGLPILATAIDGNAGVLGTSYPGLFTPDDPYELADRLAALASNPEALEQITLSSRLLQPELSIKQETARWREVLEGLLK